MAVTAMAAALGLRIRRLRRKRGLSQSALAEHVQRDRRHVSRLERGEVRVTVDELYRLALALGVDACTLLEGSEPAP